MAERPGDKKAADGPDDSLLLIEDDDSLRETLTHLLSEQGYLVEPASDGARALEIALGRDFTVVIADIHLPGLTGLEFLATFRRSKQTPVVLISGFPDVADDLQAASLGAQGFLAKPFRKRELLETLQRVTGREQESESFSEERFTCLRIEEFAAAPEIHADLFVRVADDRYFRVARADEPLDPERLARYREKGMLHIFVRADDFRAYLGLQRAAIRDTVDALAHARQVELATQAARAAMLGVYREPVDRAAFEIAVDLVAAAAEVFCEEKTALSLFELLRAQGDREFAHAMALAVYATLLAKQAGWTSPRSLLLLAMAGIMHDIGKKEIDPKLFAKRESELSKEERELYRSHPFRGYDLLGTLPGVPEEVREVVLQHHENCLGSGYPRALTKGRTVPLARLVGVVEEFCELAFPGGANEPLLLDSALERVAEGVRAGSLDRDYGRAFQALFGRSEASSG